MNRAIGIRASYISGILFISILLDRVTKIWALNTLSGMPVKSYLGDTFRLVFVENEGAFLSLGSDLSDGLRTILLTFFPVVILLALLVYTLFNNNLERIQRIAFAFILAGGFSNVYDRIVDGKVIDFMNMGIGSLRTGIFNVADMSIMLGLFIMIPFLFKKSPGKADSGGEEGGARQDQETLGEGPK